MKKIILTIIFCFIFTGCTQLEEYRNSVGVKNANELIKEIKSYYILNQTNIPINTQLDVTSFNNTKNKLKGGTYTILSKDATNDINQIRVDNVVIDDRICTGTINDMQCTKYEEN